MKADLVVKINSIMTSTEQAFSAASKSVASIWEDKIHVDEIKFARSSEDVGKLAHKISCMREQLLAVSKETKDELTSIRKDNSLGRMGKNEYQQRLLSEAAFISNLPDAITQEALMPRVALWYDDIAAQDILKGAIAQINESRTYREVKLLNTEQLFPPVYEWQLAGIDKIFQAIDNRLDYAINNFAGGKNGREMNEKVYLFMAGTFDGIRAYIRDLPESYIFPYSSDIPELTIINRKTIPCYAKDAEDLNILFSMYR